MPKPQDQKDGPLLFLSDDSGEDNFLVLQSSEDYLQIAVGSCEGTETFWPINPEQAEALRDALNKALANWPVIS